jgi:hypothetical protein
VNLWRPYRYRRPCRKWKLVEFAVFGSAARDDLRPGSDVDVVVRFAPDASWSLWDLGTGQEEFAGICGRPVHLVERGTIKNPFRLRSIMKDLTMMQSIDSAQASASVASGSYSDDNDRRRFHSAVRFFDPAVLF